MASGYHHGNVREATLDAARAMLDDVPIDRISLREVARSAGISHAAPYKHFPDRADFVRALAARCMREWIAEQRAAMGDAPDPRQRLVALGGSYIGWAASNPRAFQLVFDPVVATADGPPELLEQQREHRELLSGTLAEVVGARRLPASRSVGDIEQGLWGAVHGLAHLVILKQVQPQAVPGILGALTDP